MRVFSTFLTKAEWGRVQLKPRDTIREMQAKLPGCGGDDIIDTFEKFLFLHGSSQERQCFFLGEQTLSKSLRTRARFIGSDRATRSQEMSSVSLFWTTCAERRAFLHARTARTEKACWQPKSCMLESPTSSRWTEVSGHPSCSFVVQGILEHLCELFHIFAWTIVRRDPPRELVCQGENSGCDGDHRRRLCLEDSQIRQG